MNTSNKVIPLHTSNTIDDEASLWLVRLDNGNLSRQTKKDFKAWLAADERHLVALKAMADVWSDMDEVLNMITDEGRSKSISLWPVITPVFKPLMLAASVSFFAVLLWLTVPESVQKNTYATVVGQQLDTTFADGSIIHLNTNTVIETEFSKDKRIIKLIQGEALFEVAHDPNRPFIVYAGDRLVQAIGTKFVVHLQSENIQVTVTDGKVKMSKVAINTALSDIKKLKNTEAQYDDVFIVKGEKVIANNNQAPTLTHIKADNLQRELSWLDGKLIFDNETLFDVIEEINRYLDITIVLKDPSLHALRMSGRFDLGDSEALIEAIELSFNIQAQRIDSNKILLTKKMKT